MSIEAAIVERALTHDGVADIIGRRCYADRGPNSPRYPLIVFSIVSVNTDEFAVFGARPSLLGTRVQIDAYAESKADIVALRDQVIDAFDYGWSGSFGGTTIAQSKFDKALGDVDSEDVLSSESVRRYQMEFLVWHSNPAA